MRLPTLFAALATATLAACSSTSGASDDTKALAAINDYLATTPKLECRATLPNNVITPDRDTGKPLVTDGWYEMLEAHGFVVKRPYKDGDQAESNGDMRYMDNPSAYQSWAFTKKGEGKFALGTGDNAKMRMVCFAQRHANSIVHDPSDTTTPGSGADTLNVNEELRYLDWVTPSDQAEIVKFYKLTSPIVDDPHPGLEKAKHQENVVDPYGPNPRMADGGQ